MRILFLDDDRARHDRADRLFRGQELVHVWTAEDAQRILEDEPRFDVVCLDNDLNDHGNRSGYQAGYGFSESNGFDVAQFIVRDLDAALRPHRVVVHSHNVPYSRMMVDLLRHSSIPTTYEPFKTRASEDVTDLVQEFETQEPSMDGLPAHAVPPTGSF